MSGTCAEPNKGFLASGSISFSIANGREFSMIYLSSATVIQAFLVSPQGSHAIACSMAKLFLAEVETPTWIVEPKGGNRPNSNLSNPSVYGNDAASRRSVK